MKAPFKVICVHGLGSSPESGKVRLFRDFFSQRGIEVVAPDVNVPEFSRLSAHEALRVVSDSIHSNERDGIPRVIIANSFGGFLALHALARLSASLDHTISRCILIAPAIDPWSEDGTLLTPERVKEWKSKGELPLFCIPRNRLIPVHYRFAQELGELGVPGWKGELPLHILHGRNDEVVPISDSRRFVAAHPGVSLDEFDDDHALLSDPQGLIAAVSARVFPAG